MSSIIVWGAAIGAAVGGAGGMYGISKSNRTQIKAFKEQMKYMQLNYNYNQAALDRQEKSLYDSAMAELFNMTVNSMQNQAQVEAALGETGLEGRTNDKITQVIKGTNLRQEQGLKEAYEVDVWNVRSQKEALYIETKHAAQQARKNLTNSLIKGSAKYQKLIGDVVQGAAIGAATAGVGSALGGGASAVASAGSAGASAGATAATTAGTTSMSTALSQGMQYMQLAQGFNSFFNNQMQYRQRGVSYW